MELKIKLTDGRWLVNGKKLSELNAEENSFLNMFFISQKNNSDEAAASDYTKRKAAEQIASINYNEHQKSI